VGLPTVSVIVPLTAANGKVVDLVNKKDVADGEFIGLSAVPILNRSGNHTKLAISFHADDIRQSGNKEK